MNKLVVLFIILFPLTINAKCWIVGDMKGTTYSKTDNYTASKDEYSGKFMIAINDQSASITYSGFDTSSVIYRSLAPNTVVVLSIGDKKFVIESWSIQQNGIVLMNKLIPGYGNLDSTKSMIEKILSKC